VKALLRLQGISKKLLAQRIGGIFSIIRYKNSSHKSNYTCGFLISTRERADEKFFRCSPRDELLEMPYTLFYCTPGIFSGRGYYADMLFFEGFFRLDKLWGCF
jgi:hypothetical protein